MRHLEQAESLGGINETQIDPPHTFEVTLPNGRPLDYDTLVENVPIITTDYDDSSNPQLKLGTSGVLEQWDSQALFPVKRLSSYHGRSIEVATGKSLITDAHANEFYNLSIKGVDFSNPALMKSGTADRGYIVRGLQESIVMERILRASKVLREHGVDTEYTLGLTLHNSYVLPEGNGLDVVAEVDKPTFVQHAIRRYLQMRLLDSDDTDDSKPLVQEKAELMQKVADIDYIVSYRAMKTPYRLNEILGIKGAYEDMLHQLAEQTDNPLILSYLKENNIRVYITNELSSELGKNIARMHNAGLVHNFLHSGNITALGGIVDLDSITGETLGIGDDPINTAGCANDIAWAIAAVYQTQIDSRHLTPDYEHFFRAIDYSLMNFMNSYLSERETLSDQEIFHLLAEVMNNDEIKDISIHGSSYIISSYMADTYRNHLLIKYGNDERLQQAKACLPAAECPLPSKQEDQHFSYIPGAYLEELKGQIDSFFIYETLDELDQMPLLYQSAFKDQYVRQLVTLYDQGKLQPENMLQLFMSLDMRPSPKVPPIFTDALVPFTVSQVYKNFEHMRSQEPYTKNPCVAELLSKELAQYKDRHGILFADTDNPVDIVYIKNTAERDEVVRHFTAAASYASRDISDLGLGHILTREGTPNSKLIFITNFDGLRDELAYTLFTNKDSGVFNTFMNSGLSDRWPLAIITGTDTGDIKVYSNYMQSAAYIDHQDSLS